MLQRTNKNMRLVDLFPDFVYYFILISKHLLYFCPVNKKSIQYEIYSMLSVLFPLSPISKHTLRFTLKREYISSTSYKDEENKLSGAKGDLKKYQGDSGFAFS